jgi:hypothetical protein
LLPSDTKEICGVFRDIKGDGAAWMAFLAALFAPPMTPAALPIYQQCTGRADQPIREFVECWLICGRRAGKSLIWTPRTGSQTVADARAIGDPDRD